MKKDVLEEKVRKSGHRIIGRRKTRACDVLLSEKLITNDKRVNNAPYYETYWFVDRGDTDIGRCVRNNAYAEVNGIHRTITQEERIQDALKDAAQWIKDNVRTGRYGKA